MAQAKPYPCTNKPTKNAIMSTITIILRVRPHSETITSLSECVSAIHATTNRTQFNTTDIQTAATKHQSCFSISPIISNSDPDRVLGVSNKRLWSSMSNVQKMVLLYQTSCTYDPNFYKAWWPCSPYWKTIARAPQMLKNQFTHRSSTNSCR